MNERITSQELSPVVRRLRRWQVKFAIGGMAFFLVSLIGGAMESRWLAWVGIAGFAICLVSLIAVGIWTLARANRRRL